jgi:hypothetical protein
VKAATRERGSSGSVVETDNDHGADRSVGGSLTMVAPMQDDDAHRERDERPGTLSTADWDALVEAGVLNGPVELLSGRPTFSGEELVFTPAQVRAAAALGIRVRSCLDALLEDPEAFAEARATLMATPASQSGPANADEEARRLALRRRFVARTSAGEGVPVDDELLDGIPGARGRA